MTQANTAIVKYVYLDVVGFTRGRSVEAQSEISAQLNAMFREAIKEQGLEDDKRILIPTGDGICLAILDLSMPYDVHVQIALALLGRLQKFNESVTEATRQFQVRLGINENLDNIVVDINKNRNVAGLGVNMAQRIMSNADGGQILVGQTVFEHLRARERYFDSFRQYSATDKHGNKFHVYQYTDENSPGLSSQIPETFRPKKKEKPRLTQLAAYYPAHAVEYRDFFLLSPDQCS